MKGLDRIRPIDARNNIRIQARIMDYFCSFKCLMKKLGYHKTYSILVVAENCWKRERNTPPPTTDNNQPNLEEE